MSNEDKANNMADKATASIKEAAGKVTGDESLEEKGRAERAEADLKQTGEKLKDTLRDV